MIVTKLGKWEVGWSSLLCAVASGKVTCSVIWFLCYVLDGFAYVLCLLFIWLWWSENVTKISNELPSKWNKSKWKCIEKCIFLFQLPIGEHFFFSPIKEKVFHGRNNPDDTKVYNSSSNLTLFGFLLPYRSSQETNTSWLVSDINRECISLMCYTVSTMKF